MYQNTVIYELHPGEALLCYLQQKRKQKLLWKKSMRRRLVENRALNTACNVVRVVVLALPGRIWNTHHASFLP
jgi:hypothetical protein